MSTPEVRTKGAGATINPAVKAWIDNVIVPALLDQWAKKVLIGPAAHPNTEPGEADTPSVGERLTR